MVCSSILDIAAHLSVACNYREITMHLLFSSITYCGGLDYPLSLDSKYHLHSISPVITSNAGFAKKPVALGIPRGRRSKGIEIHAIADAKS